MSTPKRFTDEQARAFFAFVSSMEEQRYAAGNGQVPHAPLVFGLSADAAFPIGFLDMTGLGKDAPGQAIRTILAEVEGAAYVYEGFVGVERMPGGLAALIGALHRPGEPVAMWGREILTDVAGRRSLGETVLDTLSAPTKLIQ